MEVAIKAARNMVDATPDVARDRILQEGRLFWLLKHENIISLHGICLEDPNMCLIMEYARGGPLNRYEKHLVQNFTTRWRSRRIQNCVGFLP